MLVEAKFL